MLYMIKMDGIGASKWGPRWLSGTEALLLAATGSVILLTYFLMKKSQKSVDEEQTEIAVG